MLIDWVHLPFHLFGVTGNKESQRPLLHFNVISRVDQNTVQSERGLFSLMWRKSILHIQTL